MNNELLKHEMFLISENYDGEDPVVASILRKALNKIIRMEMYIEQLEQAQNQNANEPRIARLDHGTSDL